MLYSTEELKRVDPSGVYAPKSGCIMRKHDHCSPSIIYSDSNIVIYININDRAFLRTLLIECGYTLLPRVFYTHPAGVTHSFHVQFVVMVVYVLLIMIN